MACQVKGYLPVISNKPTQAALHLQESKEIRKRGIWSLFRAVYFAISEREISSDFVFLESEVALGDKMDCLRQIA